MINKKADIGLPYLIGGIIAGVILVFVLIFIFSSGTSFTKYFSWLPNFNKTIEPVKNIEIIRYDVESQSLSFYDGTQWIVFDKGQIILGEKQISHDLVFEDFQNYYFQEREQKIIQLNYKLEDFLKTITSEKGFFSHLDNTEISYIVKETSKDLKISDIKINALINKDGISASGNAIINLVEEQTNKIISRAYFVLYPNDYLEFNYKFLNYPSGEVNRKMQASMNTQAIKDIFNSAKEWKNSILKKPIKIRFNKESTSYCVEIKDKKYLIVNLADKKESC